MAGDKYIDIIKRGILFRMLPHCKMTAMAQSPRVKWVLEQVRRRYPEKFGLDIGFVGSYGTPFLHIAMREINPAPYLVGVDMDQEGVFNFRLSNTIVANAKALPFKDCSFHVVFLLEVLEHLLMPDKVLREVNRVLRPGGELLLTTPNAYAWWNLISCWMFGRLRSRIDTEVRRRYLGASDHMLFYDPISLMSLIDKYGFNPIEITTKNHAIPLLRRFIPQLSVLDLAFWPMNRFGYYICLIAKKVD